MISNTHIPLQKPPSPYPMLFTLPLFVGESHSNSSAKRDDTGLFNKDDCFFLFFHPWFFVKQSPSLLHEKAGQRYGKIFHIKLYEVNVQGMQLWGININRSMNERYRGQILVIIHIQAMFLNMFKHLMCLLTGLHKTAFWLIYCSLFSCMFSNGTFFGCISNVRYN